MDLTLTRAAAIEYSSQGVRVNAIGRLAEPEDMSEAVLFLCSPGASFIMGHVLLIDGGLTAH